MKGFFCLFAIYIMLIPAVSSGAEFEWYLKGIMIRGEIQKGDYERLLAVIKHMNYPPMGYHLDSPGGDVIEAMKIGTLLRNTYSPASLEGEHTCASACLLILIGAPEREFLGSKPIKIGLHRPYFEKQYFASLSASEAENEYLKLQNVTKQYLSDMGVTRDFIDMLFTIPSNEMVWLSSQEFTRRIGALAPFYEELILSKCGKSLTDDEEAILFDREKKYSKDLKLLVIQKRLNYTSCKNNLSAPETGKFIKELGLKVSERRKLMEWLRFDVQYVNGKYFVKDHPIRFD